MTSKSSHSFLPGEKIFNLYKGAGIKLLDSIGKDFIPLRYRAVLLAPSPKKIITSLGDAGVKAIVPVEDWELLGGLGKYPVALNLIRDTLSSIPVYPSLEDGDVKRIITAVKGY